MKSFEFKPSNLEGISGVLINIDFLIANFLIVLIFASSVVSVCVKPMGIVEHAVLD